MIMTMTTFTSYVRRTVLLIATLGALYPATTEGQTVRKDKLGPVLQVRAGQLSGRSRVIVQFHGALIPASSLAAAGWPEGGSRPPARR